MAAVVSAVHVHARPAIVAQRTSMDDGDGNRCMANMVVVVMVIVLVLVMAGAY